MLYNMVIMHILTQWPLRLI